MLTPKASQISRISELSCSLLLAAPSTFRILPLRGRSACVSRERAPLAEPPAESPSTMKSSVPSRFFAVQSVSLPGRRSFLVADLRAVSFSIRRRRRSSARSTRKSRMLPADFGSAASQVSKWSRTEFSTRRAASSVARRSLVWPTNCGSRIKHETMAQPPVSRSSRVIWSALRFLTRSP